MNFQFTNEELKVLDKALQQLPYFMSAPVINSINKQIYDQTQEVVIDEFVEVDVEK